MSGNINNDYSANRIIPPFAEEEQDQRIEGLLAKLSLNEKSELQKPENIWIQKFFTEKSTVSIKDPTIQKLASRILSTPELKTIVRERFESGTRFSGWTTDGSKGQTSLITGDISIGKTEQGTEVLTLGYECTNSKNHRAYKKIGITYAIKLDTAQNRKDFADAVIQFEAQALFIKCQLASTKEERATIAGHYLEIYDNKKLSNIEKTTALVNAIKEKGVVYRGAKSAYQFYQHERYDSITNYYKEKIEDGTITVSGR